MALKYQALNGTVISNTVTIEGLDVQNPGSPRIATGIKVLKDGNIRFFNLCGFVSQSVSTYGVYFPTSSLTSSFAGIGNEINGIYGFSCTGIYFNGPPIGNVSVNGTAIWTIMDSTTGVISQIEVPFNNTKVTSIYGIVFSKPSAGYVVSFTIRQDY